MKVIELDSSRWLTEDDVYEHLLAALGSPDWHGKNLDALWDSVREARHPTASEHEYINAVQPPYRIEVFGLSRTNPRARLVIARIQKLLQEAKSTFDVEVSLTARE